MFKFSQLPRWARLVVHCVVSYLVLMFLTHHIVLPVIMETKTETYVVTVTSKEYTGDRTLYLVFTEDENEKPYVFENRDSLFRRKFNSSDVQETIRVGETYKFTAVGYRIFYLNGWYPNIIKIEKVSANEDL